MPALRPRKLCTHILPENLRDVGKLTARPSRGISQGDVPEHHTP